MKIILVDNHNLFREGLKLWIENIGLGEVIAEADNAADFIDLLKQNNPDLVILDFEMPDMDGVDTTRLALKIQPELKILGITQQNDFNNYAEMILAGATGFMLKTSGNDEFVKAIKSVAMGECYFSEDLLPAKEIELNFY